MQNLQRLGNKRLLESKSRVKSIVKVKKRQTGIKLPIKTWFLWKRQISWPNSLSIKTFPDKC